MIWGDRSPWSRASRAETLRRKPLVEDLEGRQLLTTAMPDIQMMSATTHDSRGVSFAYDVTNGPIQAPVTIGVYRSADAQFSPDDVPVGSMQILPAGPGGPTLDQAGQPAAAVGPHQITLPLAGGLPPNPDHPYVLVVADPGHALTGSDPSLHTAEFRTHVIGVITHGGVQPTSWKHGPPWELRMASSLRNQGYDAVIPFNWVSQSNHPGAAAQQAPRLAREVAAAASQFPASEPVDVHFIGHSEGAIVNSLAIVRLQTEEPPQMRAGYLKVTMLDPHAASNAFPGPQYSIAPGVLGWLAKMDLKHFQSKANDPLPFVPANVNEAEVFFQHTPVSEAQTKFALPGTIPRTSLPSLDNLWGQVPVVGQAHYFDLTGPGISHSGRFGVQTWYQVNVVPTLGEGAPLIENNILTVATTGQAANAHRPTYTGTAAPGATVRLFADRVGSKGLVKVGQTVSNLDGTWSLTTQPLVRGRYRVVAVANVPESPGRRPIHMRPTAWASPLTIR